MRQTHESAGVRLSTARRDATDFGQVHDAHRAIDKRLTNWAKWCNREVSGTTSTSPMFRLMPRVERVEAGVPVEIDADHADAARIASGVAKLPERHRLVIGWFYVKPSAPSRMAKALGVSVRELGMLVNAARQMLVNQGV